MVVNEQTKGVNIFEVLALCVIALLNIAHIHATAKHITDGVIHWVVKQCSDVVLVGADVSRVAVEGLTHLEDASRSSKFSPEVFWDLGDGIDTDAIEAVGAH